MRISSFKDTLFVAKLALWIATRRKRGQYVILTEQKPITLTITVHRFK